MKKIRAIILTIFRRSAMPAPAQDRRVYLVGGGWGDAIMWWNYPKVEGEPFRVYGFKSRIPRPGDLLHSPMKSGQTLELEFVSIERQSDPDDMFFATVRPVRYIESSPERKSSTLQEALTA